MAFRSRPDLTAVDRFINNTANKVSCNFCHKEFLTENKLTCAREHVRKHVLRGLITLDEAAENSMGIFL
jgi:BED zinc finger